MFYIKAVLNVNQESVPYGFVKDLEGAWLSFAGDKENAKSFPNREKAVDYKNKIENMKINEEINLFIDINFFIVEE